MQVRTRFFLRLSNTLAILLSAIFMLLAGQIQNRPSEVRFVDVAPAVGLNDRVVNGGDETKTYVFESTGSGVAIWDYDQDGHLDIFIVNGSRLEGFPAGREPTNHLYRNKGDATFADVTAQAGLAHSGWGQGSASAITITTETVISLLAITAVPTSSTATMATEDFRM